jgi:hypothetical protein
MSLVSEKHKALDEANKAVAEYWNILVEESGMERRIRMQHLIIKLRDAKIEFKVAKRDEEIGQLNLNLFK